MDLIALDIVFLQLYIGIIAVAFGFIEGLIFWLFINIPLLILINRSCGSRYLHSFNEIYFVKTLPSVK